MYTSCIELGLRQLLHALLISTQFLITFKDWCLSSVFKYMVDLIHSRVITMERVTSCHCYFSSLISFCLWLASFEYQFGCNSIDNNLSRPKFLLYYTYNFFREFWLKRSWNRFEKDGPYIWARMVLLAKRYYQADKDSRRRAWTIIFFWRICYYVHVRRSSYICNVCC